MKFSGVHVSTAHVRTQHQMEYTLKGYALAYAYKNEVYFGLKPTRNHKNLTWCVPPVRWIYGWWNRQQAPTRDSGQNKHQTVLWFLSGPVNASKGKWKQNHSQSPWTRPQTARCCTVHRTAVASSPRSGTPQLGQLLGFLSSPFLGEPLGWVFCCWLPTSVPSLLSWSWTSNLNWVATIKAIPINTPNTMKAIW